MTATATTTQTLTVDAAARQMYRAELALHDAHASHVDAWIAAAAERLHEAIEAYLTAKHSEPPVRRPRQA